MTDQYADGNAIIEEVHRRPARGRREWLSALLEKIHRTE